MVSVSVLVRDVFRHPMLCYVVLCYACVVWSFVVLCCVALCCGVLYCIVLYYIICTKCSSHLRARSIDSILE